MILDTLDFLADLVDLVQTIYSIVKWCMKMVIKTVAAIFCFMRFCFRKLMPPSKSVILSGGEK